MTYEYFSDKENGIKESNSEEISLDVWKAIICVYDTLISNCSLAGEFPEQCQDGSVVCGCNKNQLEIILKGEVPEIKIPICINNYDNYYDYYEKVCELPNKYAILDFLQFIHRNIKDAEQGSYHSYHKHYHYSFSDKGLAKSEFRKRINTIFERNGITFFIDNQGQIKRSVPKMISKIVNDIKFKTEDERLNELLEIAYSKFILTSKESRCESLEKIWDAFERLKTYFEESKRASSQQLIGVISQKNTLFETHIQKEFDELTRIGNTFQIRHFERGKTKMESDLHIDYFFYRMSCLILLCIESLK